MKKDVANIEDIQLLVDAFYTKVKADDLLGSIFNGVIQDRWPEHLDKMYRFWQTVLLGEHTYYGSPFAPHAKLPMEKKHFDRWLKLFEETLDEYFSGTIAEEAKWRAAKMAEMFQYKIAYYKNNPSNSLL
jgi:hemoglobin